MSDNYMTAIYQWSGNGWRTRDGAPVQNVTQWKELLKLFRRADRQGKRVSIEWVKGHKRDEHNKRADKLAEASAGTPSERTIRPTRVRRKKSPNKVEVGSIRMRGQIETVHLITDEYLPPSHRCYRYMYEIMDEDSPDYQRVDKIHSNVLLGAGHTYRVRFNEDSSNPWIVEMLEELTDDGEAPGRFAMYIREPGAPVSRPTTTGPDVGLPAMQSAST